MKTYEEFDDKIVITLKKENPYRKGEIEIRDYIVLKAIQKNKPIHVKCDVLPGISGYRLIQLLNDCTKISQPIKSKINIDQEYRLRSYKWKGSQ